MRTDTRVHIYQRAYPTSCNLKIDSGSRLQREWQAVYKIISLATDSSKINISDKCKRKGQKKNLPHNKTHRVRKSLQPEVTKTIY
jgi:hypothetical protein